MLVITSHKGAGYVGRVPDRGYVYVQVPVDRDMTNHAYQIVEIVGSSPNGSDEAIRNAIAEASKKTLRHLDWFEVAQTRGHLVDGKVAHSQVCLKVGFRLEG